MIGMPKLTKSQGGGRLSSLSSPKFRCKGGNGPNSAPMPLATAWQ
jgi:hypothetical protein